MSKNRQKFSLTRAIKHSREGLHPSRPSKPVSQINNRRRQSEVQFFDLANSLPVIIWLWDVNLHCSWLNNFWSEYTGLDTTQSLTNGWLEAMHPEDQPGWLAAFALGTANCRAIRHEFRLTKSEGGYRWIALRAEPRYTKDRVFEGLTGTGTDITELYESRIEAERLAQTRTALLSTVSHEIRTPMNGILGLTTLALNQPINEEVRDQLTGIAASSKGLINILNDILDFSKIESNSLTLANTPTDLKKLVNLLFDLYQPPAFMAGLTFSTHVSPKIPPFVQVDEKRLFQTLSNLLSNAIKFTAKGSVKLEIACLNHVQTHMTLRFTVVDTGIGLDKNKLIDLVQPFVQADSSISRKYGGAGLGLSISQGILHTMGSQLQVESEPSQGSTFYFDLALTISENHDSTSRFSEMNTIDPVVSLQKIFNDKLLTGKHILLAEDNRINQQVALSFLKRAGAKIELANNGIEALALLKEMKFDAILMDVQMPELDGLDATRKIRQQKEFQLIPIIGLSAGISAHERNACLDCGMNDFLPKPINPEQLVQTIQKWTESIKTDEKSGEQYQPSYQSPSS